ncbi:DUF302 domain-containing protein [Candidatus Micrarchaeota archaeon]|nr:DUF302 domain-containing protein [Candidatus Micrarchaeota archaeon]
MNIEEFAYEVETEKKFGDAVVSVLKSAEQKGWALFQVYDIAERLAANGFEQKPVKIIEICSAKHANQFMNANRLVALCLPCKIVVLEDNGKVRIAGMKHALVSQFFPEVSPEQTVQADTEIREIVDNSR